MVTPEREDSCIIKWDPQVLNLDELTVFISYIADLHSEVAVPYVTTQFSQSVESQEAPASPQVAYIRMESPLIAELISSSGNGLGVLALGMVGYLIKHPENLGGWLSRVRTASYRHRIEALEQRAEYLRTRAAIEVQGRPIGRFENAAREDRDRAAREDRDRAAREDRDRAAREDRDRAAREDRDKAAREDRDKAARQGRITGSRRSRGA